MGIQLRGKDGGTARKSSRAKTRLYWSEY